MRLSKGAGVSELAGIKAVDKRENYTLIRPLLDSTKDELLRYLENRNIKYFIDSSNFSSKYERNRFRDSVNSLLKNGKSGFVKSFEILAKESEILSSSYKLVFKEKKFLQIELENKELIANAASKYLKELGYLISGKEREELLKKGSIVAGRLWSIEYSKPYLYIAPYVKTIMPKEFKERCRIKKIPPKIRAYLYVEKIPLQGSC
jgi:tRNA(Ile)-lysidine synthase